MMRTLLALVAVVAASLAPVPAADAAGVTVILVRHAETAGDTSSGGTDPGLSEAGRARAAALARVLEDAGVTHVYASEFVRTQATVAPLASGVRAEVTLIPARELDAQVAALRALPAGAVAVVAGHSNTIPALVERLGGRMTGLEASERHGALIPHDEYDRLVVVLLESGRDAAPTVELRYGP